MQFIEEELTDILSAKTTQNCVVSIGVTHLFCSSLLVIFTSFKLAFGLLNNYVLAAS
jgi:hypothetical protein